MSQNAALDAHAVRHRAHERWLQRGCPAGSAEQDWLEAERELSAEAAHVATTVRELGCVAVSPTETRPLVPRRVPRSIVTRTASGPAARLLVALVPTAGETLRTPASSLTVPRRSR